MKQRHEWMNGIRKKSGQDGKHEGALRNLDIQ
jgi:hypothetical protein